MFSPSRRFDDVMQAYGLMTRQAREAFNEEANNYNLAIASLDKPEKKLGRDASVMELKADLLKDYVKKRPEERTASTFNSIYLSKLDELYEEEFFSNYEFCLNRDGGVFVDNDFISFTEQNKPELLNNFRNLLAGEKSEDVFFHIDDKTNVESLVKELEAGLKKTQRRVDCVREQKEIIASNLHDRRVFFGGLQREYREEAEELLYPGQMEGLFAAVDAGNLDGLKKLVVEKKKIARQIINQKNADGRTLLQRACSFGYANIVGFLLKQGAKTNVKDLNGYLPVHYAVVNQNENTVRVLNLLKSEDAKIAEGKGPYDRLALHTAALCNNVRATEWLIANGSPLNAVERGSAPLWSPLHVAACYGYEKVVELLLNAKGIDAKVENRNKQTPLYDAIYSGHENIAKLFFDKGYFLGNLERVNFKKDAEKMPHMHEIVDGFLGSFARTKVEVGVQVLTQGFFGASVGKEVQTERNVAENSLG